MASTPHGINFEAHRPVVMGSRGMVCSAHPLASQAGIAMLQMGGNAMDAAIATAAALNVVEPLMSGIGGDGFIMVYQREGDRLEVCNGTGAAPYAADPSRFQSKGLPMKGVLSASTPGLLDAWLVVHERYGSLSLSQALAPAIDLAENGFPVSHVLAQAIAAEPMLGRLPASRAIFTLDGRPLQAGQVLYQKDLARTFQAIVAGGRDVFYGGDIGRALVQFIQDQGGLITLQDLADCRAQWQEPIHTGYRGHIVYEAPPNSSGHVLLQELGLVEQFDLQSLGCNTAESIHLMVEAKKLAFADREAYVADPRFVDVPIQGLVSKEYARERAGLIDPRRATSHVPAGNPRGHQSGHPDAAAVAQEEDTTCFVVADRWGNAVCQLQSLQSAWGSSVVAGDTGILLNNRMTYWHLDPGHVDFLQPGKRVRHTMNPVMVFTDATQPGSPATGSKTAKSNARQLVMACGTPGADTQVQTNLQVISHVVDFGMTVAEAVEAPRWRNTHGPTESTIPHEGDDLLYLEDRFGSQVRAGLTDKGHRLEILGPWAASGCEVMVQVDPGTGTLCGAADPRRDGYAIGW